MTITATRYTGTATTVEELIAAEMAAVEQYLAVGESDVDLVRITTVVDEDGNTLTVPLAATLDAFYSCDACDTLAAEGLGGRRNCHGFYCANDDMANACHAECYL